MSGFKTTCRIVNLQNPTINNKIVAEHLVSKTPGKDKTKTNVKFNMGW